MIIKNWKFKNFKSWGNTWTEFNVNPDGGLSLFIGANENGKTALMQSLEFAINGEVMNKKSKRTVISKLPNRMNGDMETEVTFDTKDCPNVQINRKYTTALKTTLFENGKENKNADKKQRIEEILPFDHTAFKSFVSLNVKNFKSFLTLTPEDKRLLLDKLFNIEIINELDKIRKKLLTTNQSKYSTISNEIKIHTNTINELKKSIEETLKNSEKEKDTTLKKLNEKLLSYKPQYEELDNKGVELSNIVDTIIIEHNKLNDKVNDFKREIATLDKQIAFFKDNETCPTCTQAIDANLKKNILEDYCTRKEKTLSLISELDKELKESGNTLKSNQLALNENNRILTELTNTLTGIKSEITTTKKQVFDVTPFQTNLDNTTSLLTDKQTEYDEVVRLNYVYELLGTIWGETGIKKDIIEKILLPLNQFIQEHINILGMRYELLINNNFDVEVYEYGELIDDDGLSTGADIKINMAIMLAYLKMIRMKTHINLLILDEVFASIDMNGIDTVIKMFYDFAKDKKVNVFLIHHSELKPQYFDNIYLVEKHIHSELITIK